MKSLYHLFSIFILVQLIRPSLAFDISELEWYYYVIAGCAVGVVVGGIIACCCCCSKNKKKSEKQRPAHISEIRISGTRYESEPPVSGNEASQPTSPLVLETESERQAAINAAHRRRLDAILTTQASAVRRDNVPDSSTRDRTESYDNTSVENNHGQFSVENHHGQFSAETQTSRQLHTMTPLPRPVIDESDEEVVIPSVSDQQHAFNSDSIMGSFQRVLPSSGFPQEHRSTREFHQSAPPPKVEETPEFMGIKLKPIVLNKAGGTYIPPEDF